MVTEKFPAASNVPPPRVDQFAKAAATSVEASTVKASPLVPPASVNVAAPALVRPTPPVSVALMVASALRRIGGGQPNACWWFDLNHADGDAARGLWIPLGAYGVSTVR